MLPVVLVFDNDDLAAPFRKVAEFQRGKTNFIATSIPAWMASVI